MRSVEGVGQRGIEIRRGEQRSWEWWGELAQSVVVAEEFLEIASAHGSAVSPCEPHGLIFRGHELLALRFGRTPVHEAAETEIVLIVAGARAAKQLVRISDEGFKLSRRPQPLQGVIKGAPRRVPCLMLDFLLVDAQVDLGYRRVEPQIVEH